MRPVALMLVMVSSPWGGMLSGWKAMNMTASSQLLKVRLTWKVRLFFKL